MFVSAPVVSTRILRPWITPFSRAMATILSWIASITSGKLAVDQVGAHFSLEYGVAPVANVLQNERAHDHFGGEAPPTARTAQETAFGERRVRGRYDLLVREHLVDVDHHPLFVETINFVSDQFVAEVELCAPRINHALSFRALIEMHPDATYDG